MADRDLCGKKLGDFVVLEQIGEGGAGAIYRCAQPMLKREAVVKVLREWRRGDNDARARFWREAQLASQLDHHYAAHIYAFNIDETDNLPWIAMEFVRGRTLEQWLREHGPMPVEKFVPFFDCVAEVVQAAHERGIVHRDLKPSNVMVIEHGGRMFPKLLDFGIAKLSHETPPTLPVVLPASATGCFIEAQQADGGGDAVTRTDPAVDNWNITASGIGIGSWAYMSPEQWGDAKAVGPASDVYSLGILAYRALTGRLPFTGETERDIYRHHVSTPVPPLGGEFSAELDRFFQRALAKLPEARHRNALELASELRSALQTSEREFLQSVAKRWHDRDRTSALLWGREALEDVDKLTRHAPAGALGDLACSFVAASQRRVRRFTWLRRLVPVAAVAIAAGGFAYRSVLQARMAENLVTQAEVEQGRQALLHSELREAQLHLAEAYRRGDRSLGTRFMLSRAMQPGQAEQARLTSVAGRMWWASFSPDGTQIVTTDDQSAQVWDAKTFQRLHVLTHGATVSHAAYSADGAWLITAANDGLVRIWDARGGALVRELATAGKPRRYYMVAVSGDRRQVASITRTGEMLDVWDAATGALIAELRNTGAASYPLLAFSADARWLATGAGGEARVVDTTNWKTVHTIGPRVQSLSFDPHGSRLMTGTSSGDATIWTIPSGQKDRHLRQLGDSVDRVAWSPDGRLVVIASRDGTEQVFDAASGLIQSQGNYLHDQIQSLEFDTTAKLVLATSRTGTVVVSDAALGMSVATFEGSRSILPVARFDPGSRRIVGAYWDGTARVWDASPTYQRWNSPPIMDECHIATSLEPDRRFVAIGCLDQRTRVWDTSRDRLLAELPSMPTAADGFAPALPAVSVDGSLAAIARGNVVDIYQLPGGTLLRSVTHPGAVTVVAFSTTRADLVSGSADGSVQVTRAGRAAVDLPPCKGGIDAAAILSDGRVVVADAHNRLRIYDRDLNTVLADIDAATRVGLLRMSADDSRLVTIPHQMGSAASPSLWSLDNYSLIARLNGHLGRVFSARFVRDDREVFTTGGDGAVRSWSAATGEKGKVYRGGARYIADVVLTRDGTMVVAGDGEGLLRYWEASSARPLWMMQAHKTAVVGLHFEGDDVVTRGYGGDISRWRVPEVPETVTAAPVERP